MGNNEEMSARITVIDQAILEAQRGIKNYRKELKKTKNPEGISSLEMSIAWQEHQIEVLGNERNDLQRRLTRKEPTGAEIIAALRKEQKESDKRLRKVRRQFIG